MRFGIQLAACVSALVLCVSAQSNKPEPVGDLSPEIRSTVEQLTQAWQRRDSARVKATIAAEARLVGLNGQPIPNLSPADWFSENSTKNVPKAIAVFSTSDLAVVRLEKTKGESSTPNFLTLQKLGDEWKVVLVQVSLNKNSPWPIWYSTVQGLPINVPGGSELNAQQIGHISVCWGWEVTGHTEKVYWGDNEFDEGNMWQEPLSAGKFVASHRYKGVQQYVVAMEVNANCYYKNGGYEEWRNDVAVGTTILNVYIPNSLVKFQLPKTAVHGTTVQGIVTVKCPAPPWNTTVNLHSSDWDRATVQPSVDVQPNAILLSASFDVKTGSPGSVQITASIGAQQITRTLTVK